MSVCLRLRLTGTPTRGMLDLGLEDLRWLGEAPPDPLTEGSWQAYRDRLSTRTTTLEYAQGVLSITVRVGASDEDCDVALAFLHRAAPHAAPTVDADVFGERTVAEVEEAMGPAWRREQRASAARVAITLSRERGPISMPGPTRAVCIGPTVLAELESVAEEERGELLVRIMRRVLWPDPRYEGAGRFTATGLDGREITLAILLPERACVLPATDKFALQDGDEVLLLPRACLRQLPIETTPLDDGNDLVEAIPGDAWPRVCAAARGLVRG